MQKTRTNGFSKTLRRLRQHGSRGIFFIAFLAVQSQLPALWAEDLDTDPILSIKLHIHVSQTSRDIGTWVPIAEEINRIWLSQARICFDTRITRFDASSTDGFDLWFSPDAEDMNGYYIGPHEIWVREEPVLQPVGIPARYPAARTAAHELGHALGLSHRQDSDENLMRSKTLGWQLNPEEIRQARLNGARHGAALADDKACRAIPDSPVEHSDGY